MTIPHLRPLAGVLALALASTLTPVLATPAVEAAPSAHAARASARPRPKVCDVSAVSDRLGPTSVTSLKVVRVRCDTGIAVVRAFHGCRLANGPSGRCVRLVRGYACIETRTNAPTQISATVTCRKDRASVVHRYTQTL